MPKFTATLSSKSFQKLTNEIINYKRDLLKNKLEEFTLRIADRGVEIAKSEIADLDAVFTGELLNSITVRQGETTEDKVVFYVVADSSHAIYVEMGTGIVGASNSYPGKLPAVYAQGKTIHETKDGRYGWFYYRDGQWWFTEGMASRPFMFNTANRLRNTDIEQIAKEVFGA
jgi:hypothetical protein